MGETRELVSWVVDMSCDDLPSETIEHTKGLLLKTVTSMLIGTQEPLGRTILRYTTGLGGTPEAGVVGAGSRTTLEAAAFANGTLAHATETEDAYFFPNNEAVASCWVFPVVLTVGQASHASGRDVLAATVAAFEAASRTARAAPGVGIRNGINTATWFGVPAAALAVARLRGLDVERATNAFSIAASQSSGLVSQLGYDAHTLEAGHSCRAGVTSALLAEAGATGVPDLLEGGPGRLFAPVWDDGTVDLAVVTDGLGKPPFDVHMVEFKKYPGCGYVHASVDALAVLLQEEALAAADVAAVEVEVHSMAKKYCDRLEPRTIGEARFSFQYVLAEVLQRGRVDHTSFWGTERLTAAGFLAEQRKVRIVVNPNWADDYKGSRVTVTTVSGATLTRELKAFRGHPENPLTLQETAAVLRPFLSSVLVEEERERVESMVLALDELGDVGELMSLLTNFTGRP